jgi:hypothetical protein
MQQQQQHLQDLPLLLLLSLLVLTQHQSFAVQLSCCGCCTHCCAPPMFQFC